MYKRNIPPLLEFMATTPPARYYIDAGFGRLYYVSSEVSGTIHTRTDASGATVIVEVSAAGLEDMAQPPERVGLRPAGPRALPDGGKPQRS